jgi:NAD(P)-dependent dehydrogenase (short-subunit alcohol dehydrogenase family)
MNGDRILITGAPSGIGRAAARLLANSGFRVFNASPRKQPDEGGVEMLELDVRSDDSLQRCVEEVPARAGQIDLLVNNAGLMPMGIAEETAPEAAWAVFETNFFGVVRTVNAVLPGMRQPKRGRNRAGGHLRQSGQDHPDPPRQSL